MDLYTTLVSVPRRRPTHARRDASVNHRRRQRASECRARARGSSLQASRCELQLQEAGHRFLPTLTSFCGRGRFTRVKQSTCRLFSKSIELSKHTKASAAVLLSLWLLLMPQTGALLAFVVGSSRAARRKDFIRRKSDSRLLTPHCPQPDPFPPPNCPFLPPSLLRPLFLSVCCRC